MSGEAGEEPYAGRFEKRDGHWGTVNPGSTYPWHWLPQWLDDSLEGIVRDAESAAYHKGWDAAWRTSEIPRDYRRERGSF